MIKSKLQIIGILITYVLLTFLLGQCTMSSNHVDYNVDVKPILNKHCISCHGGVKQNSGFSLLTRELALEPAESGMAAIVPGNAGQSEMIKRIQSDDEDERMPQNAEALDRSEIDILKRWINQGANWDLHWAYRPLIEQNEKSARLGFFFKSKRVESNSIDDHIDNKLKSIRLTPNDRAKKPELLRRVSLAITGLPPGHRLTSQFVDDQSLSYEDAVEELLNREEFGEKWAAMWLDIARYADSKGYERDENRKIWRYRDYVIRSFNDDKPYNQFVLEQLAGDLLPDPTDDQLVATGFHRNTTTNDEGGTNNEEYRVKAVIDRVSTTWEGLMGTTMACVQCHGHPYDPFEHQEFYQSMAFLNNTRDADTHADYPRLNFLDSVDQHELTQLKDWISEVDSEEKSKEIETFVRTVSPVIYSIETKDLKNAALYDTKYLGLRKNGSARLNNVELTGKEVLLIRADPMTNTGFLKVHLNSIDGPIIGSSQLIDWKQGYGILEISLATITGKHDLVFEFTDEKMSTYNRPGFFMDWLYFTTHFEGKADPEYSKNKSRFYNLLAKWHDHTLIMNENPDDYRRNTHVFDRGNWMTLTDEVQAKVPKIFDQISDESIIPDRLAFANWIVDERNPLTARTFVNRIWEQLFGIGIVSTTEDFGSQGAKPSNQELLDWLSYKWMHEHEWSIKSLIREIVLSDAFTRSAFHTTESLEKDPDNQFISRGPRFRLSAEQVRDQALAMSGLLTKKMFGPSVMPYQPDNIWQIPYSYQQWIISEGEDRYRRAIYTFIKRSGIYPSMETFDGAERQVCESRRIRTNTPLQALVTLNDPVFTEASNYLAHRMKTEGGDNIGDQVSYAYRLGMARDISAGKKEILMDLYDSIIKDPAEASQDSIESLAYYTVANAILNLDELLNN